ncbi:MAG: STAS domain-containing protein [Ilumatobacteraceae bacterium]
MNSRDEVEFGVEVAHINGETVVAVRGEVDASTAAAFRAAVETFDGEGGRVVIDLSAVSFMDSSGLSVIAGTLLRQERAGATLCIRNPRHQTRQILELSGLDQLLTIDVTVAHY